MASTPPSLSSYDSSDDSDNAFLLLHDDDSPASLSDWSADPPLSADDSHSSDSDDSNLCWHAKSKLLHKKRSFNSASEHLTFFGALRKGFCTRNILDRRFEVYKSHKSVDKGTIPGGSDTVQQEKNRVKTSIGGSTGETAANGESEGCPQKHVEVSTISECTTAGTPKNLLQKAVLLGNHFEQDIRTHRVGVDSMDEKEVTGREKEARQKAEMKRVAELTKVVERDGKGPFKKLTDGKRFAENLYKGFSHKEYGGPPAEVEIGVSRTNSSPVKSIIRDEFVKVKEVDQSNFHAKISESQSCWRESEQKSLNKKVEWKPIMPDSSSMPLENQVQTGMTGDASESKAKETKPLDTSSVEHSNDIQTKEPLSSDSDILQERSDAADVSTSLVCRSSEEDSLDTISEIEVNPLEIPIDEAKSVDVPLQIYKKEKQPPEMVIKESKRKAKAKKVKASKGRKVHLFRDGFTLPSATEPVEETEIATRVPEQQSKLSNGVKSPLVAVKNPVIIKEMVTTLTTADDLRSTVRGKTDSVGANGSLNDQGRGASATHAPGPFDGNDGVPPGDSNASVVIENSSWISVLITSCQNGKARETDLSHADAVVSDTQSEVPSSSAASRQNMEDGDATKIPCTKVQSAAQSHPQAQTYAFSKENVLNSVSSSAFSPSQKSSRDSFPRLNFVAPSDVMAALKPTSCAKSLKLPSSSVNDSSGPSVSSSSLTSRTTSVIVDPESSKIIQETSTIIETITSSASSNSPALCVAPSVAHVSRKKVAPSAAVSSGPRSSTDMGARINAPNPGIMQASVSQIQAYAPSPESTLASQEEINPPAFFQTDIGVSSNPLWLPLGSTSGPGSSVPMDAATFPYFGQVIGCVNKTLLMYKQMKSFRIEAKYLSNLPHIFPGSCKLFLFNIEDQQLHGIYVSSSLHSISADREFSIAFECVEDYALPLTVGELASVLPEARHMDGSPLLLPSHMVEHLATMFDRKNKSRVSWVSSTTIPLPLSGNHRLLGSSEESSLPVSKSAFVRNHTVEVRGQGYSVTSEGQTALTTSEGVKGYWSHVSSSPSGDVLENGQPSIALEFDPLLAPAQVFPFPVSSPITQKESKSGRQEGAQNEVAWKPPEQGISPSPMALWPHLFPKATPTDHQNLESSSLIHVESREGTNGQIQYSSLSENFKKGSQPDPEVEMQTVPLVPESAGRSKGQRPKQAYNPLAVEQGRQRQLFEGSKLSSWSPVVSDHDLPQTSHVGHIQRSQDNHLIGSAALFPTSEQVKMKSVPVNGSGPSSPTLSRSGPAFFDTLRTDSALSRTIGVPNFAERDDEPHLIHTSAKSSEIATDTVHLGQAHLCCYCFTRRADHLIIDCRHLGPCLECAASKKIEHCGQPNCQTKVTRLLRLFL